MARFDGKVILISGAARGQGAAEARLLVAEGAQVIMGDVLEAEGQALAQELGTAAQFLRLDVTEEADWARAVAAAEARGCGRLPHGSRGLMGKRRPGRYRLGATEAWG